MKCMLSYKFNNSMDLNGSQWISMDVWLVLDVGGLPLQSSLTLQDSSKVTK